MTPPDDGGLGLPTDHVVCRNCEARCATSWSFCRNCEASLDDALPPEEAYDDDIPGIQAADGCLKCGHESATVDEIATTGTGVTRLFDLQNRTFTAVVCDRCGYTEFYNQRMRDEVVLDLFFG